MKQKKWFLAFLTLAFAIVFSFAVVSCGKPETSSSSSSGPMTDGSEIGVYYYDAGGTEYQISLGDDYQVLFLVKDANKAGVYALEGDTLTFTFAQGESEELSATLGGNIITLNYAGSEMRFYKKIFYDVTFASEGVGDSVVSVVNGKTVAQPADPVRSGYTFIGWYADEAFTQPYFFGTPVTSSITVYGCWGQVIPGQSEFTVGFDLNYEGAPDMESVQTIGATLYKLPEAEREGYEFVGWWSSMYDSAEQLTCQYTAGTVLAESTTLYAVWKETGAAIASPAVSVSATAVSWSGVQGASYTIEITGPDGFTPISETTAAALYNLSFADAPAGDYTIKVTVTTSAGSAETVRYYKNRALARVSLFTVTETSTLIFTPVENAERYYITVNCGNDAHSHEHFALGNSTYYNFANCEMQEGGITFTVTAEADGWASSTSRAFVYNRELAQVGGFYFDEATETLYWDPVPDAASYVVSVSCGDPSHSHSYVDIGNRTSYSLKDCTPSEDGVVVSVYPRTKGYNVPVAATYTYNKTTLATPHELRIEEGALLKWSDVGAESYVIMIGNVEYTSAVNSFDLSGVLKNVGDYTVKVRAIGTSASVNSLWSDAFDVRYAAMYGTLSYSQSVVSWRYVVGAVSYNVKVNDGEAFSVDAGLNYAEVTLTKEGYNTIAVSFTDEDGNVSEWATIEVFANVITFDSLGGTSVPSQYKAVGDKITLPESSKTGQVFVGWYNVPGGGEVNGAKYTDEIFAEASSITLFAAWEASPYTAQYDAGAGSTTAPSATVYYEKPFTFEVPEIDDTRFVFMGWYSQPDGTGVRYTDEGGASLVVWPAAKDMVVYAYWAEVFAFIETTAKNGEPSYAVTQGPDIGVMTNIRVPAYYNGVLVSDVYSGAFSNCKNLVSIDIPDSVETIGATTDATANGPFGGCSLLEAVNIYAVEGNHTPRYMSVDGVLFDNNENTNTLRLAYFPVAKTGEYRLPDGVEELPLKSFASMKITAITIPSSVTIIGEDAFYNCKNLTTVIFESAASGEEAKPLTIAKDAFRSCVALRSVTLPNRLSENSAIDIFSGCTKLLEINVEKGNAYYSSVNGLLCDSTGSTVLYCPLGVSGEYTIPNGITAIGANAFQSRTQITSLIIPDYVTAIGEYAFAGCTRLTSVTFRGTAAPTTTAIGNYAFYNCTLLNSVTFEASSDVVSFGDYSFAQCSKLTNIVIPASTQSVGSYAFQGDIMLATVSFADGGDSLTLGNYVFSECVSLTSVYLPATLTAIELNIFDGCENIEGVYVDEANEYFTSVDEGVLYDKNLTEILFYPKVRGNYTLPSTVTTIGAGAFAENQVMTSITIPKTVTLIKANAFYRCLSLTEIIFEEGGTDELTLEEYAFASSAYVESLVLPDRLKVIGDYAFDHVVSLSTLTFGTQLTAIGAGAFAGTSVTSIVIPDTVTEIGEQAFDGCESLTSITLPANETISGAAFSNCPELATVVIPEGVKYIADQAFRDCVALVNITLPAGLISIGAQAFYNCTSLTSLNIPNTVTFIGWGAFAHCSSLAEFTFEKGGEDDLVFGDCPDWVSSSSLESSYGIFANCISLTAIELSNRVTAINANCFYFLSTTSTLKSITFEEGSRLKSIGRLSFGNAALQELILPEGLETIDFRAFYQNKSLVSVSLPGSLVSLGEDAFYNNIQLKSATFANGTEPLTIVAGAFEGCTALESVVLPQNLGAIGDGVFTKCTSLSSISINGTSEKFAVDSGILYDAAKTSIVAVPVALTGEVVLPGTLTAIANYAFQSSQLSKITLPEGLETIGTYAFASSMITSMEIPSSVTSIGIWAFSACTKLTTVTFAKNSQVTNLTHVFRTSAIQTIEIPASVTNLSYTFYQCKSLKTVTFEEGSQLKTVTGYAFSGAGPTTGITVTLPSGVTEIAAYAFGGSSATASSQLLSITIPNTVTSIAGNAFRYCTKLTSVIFEEGGEEPLVFADGTYNATLSSGAFVGCSGLVSITFPERLTKIGKWTFHKCTKLATINFAENGDLTTIEDGAFYGCTALKTLVLPEGLTTLGTSTTLTSATIGSFGGCTALTSVTLPATLSNLLVNQFGNCSKLAEISVAEGSQYYKAIDNVLYTADGLSLVYYPVARANTALTIPEGVTTIKAYAIGGRSTTAGNYPSALATVAIPASVTTIEDGAFRYIKTITSVTFAENSKLTSLGQLAFGACTALTSISLPESLKELPVSAFNGCSKLASVQFSSKLEAIGNTAFSGCTVLASITLPATLKTFGTGIFTNCSSLTSVELPEGITEITGSMFSGCTKLTSVYIPDSVTSIGASAFNKCSSLAEISIPDKVTTIGTSAFSGCSALTEITLPSRLEGILASTFATCTKLQSIVIPSSVTLIGNLAFSGCSALEGIEIPYSVESIGVNAFLNCTSLVEVYISEGVTSIGNTAFSGCTNLEYIFIPGTVATIGTNAFLNCAKISFDLAGDNTDYAVDDSGVLFDSAMTTLIYFPKNVTGEYALPDTVTTIGANAFSGSSLTKVVIPAGVTEIPANAFQNSLSLKEVVLPDRIATIGNYAFSGCTALESITIGRFVTSIGSYAFDGCTKLASVTFTANGNDVLTIGNYAFNECTALEAVQLPRRVRNRVSYSTTGSVSSVTLGIGNYAFYGCTKLATVAFEQTGAWLLTEYLGIGSYAFSGCTALKAIEFPTYLGTQSVAAGSQSSFYVSIGSYCFAGCTLLSDVRFSRVSTYTYLGEYVFKDCTSLVSIDLTPNGLYISNAGSQKGGTGLFSGCTSLKEVTISAFGWSASNVFEGCTALETVRVVGNSSIASIPAGTFEGFTSLKSVVIESNITKINARVFKGCTSLTSLVIPESVTTIDVSAFEGSGITSINIPKLVTKIDSTAFLNCTALTEITVDSGNAKYCSVDGVLFDKDMTTVICCPAGKVAASYALPEGVTAIGDYAFSGCTSIGSITIAETTVSVGANAFDGWTETQKIDIGFTEAPEGWDAAWDTGCAASVSWKEAPEEGTDPDDGEGGDEGAEDSPEDSAEDAA